MNNREDVKKLKHNIKSLRKALTDLKKENQRFTERLRQESQNKELIDYNINLNNHIIKQYQEEFNQDTQQLQQLNL